MGRPIEGIEADAMSALEAWSWPGNVRELENVIRRAVALETGIRIRLASLPDSVRGVASGAARALEDKGFQLESHLDELRRRYIQEALTRSSGKLVEAAKALGITFRAIRYYAKKYALR